MPGIDDFIKMAAQGLGESESTTRSATGGLLGVLKENADSGDFSKLLDAIPGAASLVGGASGAKAASGGGIGGLLGAATSALGGGGDLGSALGVLASIQKSGLSMENIGKLVSMFMKFARSNAGDGVVNNLLSKAPELAKLAD